MKRLVASIVIVVAGVACTSGEAEPSTGTYTIQFPSTAAAIATESVRVLAFDVPDPGARGGLCQELITAHRTTPGSLSPRVVGEPQSVCAMRAGGQALTVPYGEHALLAIAQRRDADDQLQDFLIGCAIMTIGNGDAPVPIPVHLVSVNVPVPPTTCGSVGDHCSGACEL